MLLRDCLFGLIHVPNLGKETDASVDLMSVDTIINGKVRRRIFVFIVFLVFIS